ncbi:mmgE/PrpD family protein [Ochrobactrum quorumnocens]|uniref:MmgE/PrpD family protein n=1 Tax=Ochrobactrum quorumnocens TaxID=271865 RepID=A0A248UCS5_9HYPH|nr:MmgE/PrpD family protein [[Ochrobactrum] quorumnocens]ASV84466.1 mmgE/PrpD family protein [[Ochrobactrum] quorumnocens]
MTDHVTKTLSQAIIGSEPSPEAIAVARTAIVDFLACALGGANDRSTLLVRKVLGASGNVALIGTSGTADPFTAALINGHAAHVLDYDDVHGSVRGHPTIAIVPALLAVAAENNVRADAFVAAYIVGLETMARLGLAMGTKHYETGFHATATLGTIGAAAAIAHLLKFDAATTAVALGLAATQSAGLRLQFGYDAKPLHAGFAARAGLTAARLAEAGFLGAPDFIDNTNGFFKAFAFGADEVSRVTQGWGEPWQIIVPGLTLKAFPCCTAAHPVGVGALALRNEKALQPDQIAAVSITFPPGGDAALVTTRPVTGIDARFSPEYIFAAALRDGKLAIAHFDDRPVDADLAQLAAKVTRRHDENAPRLSPDPKTRFVIIDVTLKEGSTLSQRVDGLPSISDPIEKFKDATKDNPRFAGIPDLVQSMTSADDLQKLISWLNQSPE